MSKPSVPRKIKNSCLLTCHLSVSRIFAQGELNPLLSTVKSVFATIRGKMDSSNVLHMVLHIPTIIENIFSCLDKSALDNCMLVCKLWCGIVKEFRQRQHKLKWFVYEPTIICGEIHNTRGLWDSRPVTKLLLTHFNRQKVQCCQGRVRIIHVLLGYKKSCN